MHRFRHRSLYILLLSCVAAAALHVVTASARQVGAVVQPQNGGLQFDGGLLAKELRHPALDIPDVARPVAALTAEIATRSTDALASLGVGSDGALVDARSGRFETLLPSLPLVAARSAVGQSLEQRTAEARDAFTRFLDTNSQELGVDVGELGTIRVTVHEDGTVIQVYVPRVAGGIPVLGSHITGVINHGNLTLFGIHRWGDVQVSLEALISASDATAIAAAHMAPYVLDGSWNRDQLVLVPTAQGDGYGHRLAWQIHPRLERELVNFELVVDAHSGELLSARDTNAYQAEVKGGVLPVSNDGVTPDGVEQPGWPMPFDNITTTGGTVTTDTGGNLVATGSMTSTLSGLFINMNDNCGSISLTQIDSIDFGASGGTDCVTPGVGGAGNTHASRTGFYELNRIAEMARGQLPANTWLQQQLTSNMNINNTCNAFWNGATVNFYRSGGGCANTGEIAGVFDHEWGHGMDDNDANPSISSPSGEGIADIYTALRLNDSCIGRNFIPATPCGGFGDPCLTCTGVRDIDYLKRVSGNPHTYTWSNANCGGSVHCVGGVYSEAVWSLWKRKLQSAPYNYDNNTAHEIVNRLTYIGAGNVGTWFSGGPPFGGCGASGGYLNYLAAAADNGNLNDGTPHMQAIFDAFNDQEIACATPTVQDSGGAGTPATAPSVSTNPGNQQIGLTWGAVSSASEYHLFRTEGVFACDFGKVKIGETAGTSWNDTGLQNGRAYSYVVVPMGATDSNFGPASACATDQPVGQPDFTVSCAPSSPSIAQGSSDTATCTASSRFGYTGDVGLSCSGNPAGVGCTFAPPSVSPPANGSTDSTLTLTIGGSQATGTVAFNVVGDDGSNTRTFGVSVQVIPAGSNGPQNTVFDAGLGVPKCAVAGSSCDSTSLLDSRDSLSPPESNQPNTLNVCTDGTSGTYHNDESTDRLVVSTLDGGNFTEGDTVQIDATVYAWSTGTSDTLDLYYASDATSPSWVFIGSIVPPGGGLRTLTAQYTLPAGGMQAVRANFRYQGAASPCSIGNWDDHDDLAFAVDSLSVPTVSSIAPTSGTVAGGTGVTITGTNFVTGAMVSIGGVAATSVMVVNAQTITATTGAHGAGAVDVVVTNPDTQTDTLPNGFAYVVQSGTPFTDDPLVAGTTVIKAVHFIQLRERINEQLARFLRPVHLYSNLITAGVTIRAMDLTEMYTAVNNALDAAGQPAIAVPTVTPGATAVSVSHLNNLRAAVLTLEGL